MLALTNRQQTPFVLLHALNALLATVHPSWERKERKSAVATKVATMQIITRSVSAHAIAFPIPVM